MKRPQAVTAAILIAAGASHVAFATIDKLESCGTQWMGGRAGARRGATNLFKLTGFGVDFATSADTSIAGSSVAITERKNGQGSYIRIAISIPDGDPLIGAQVRIRYAIGGPDTFLVDAYPFPKVNTLSFVPGPGVSSSGGVPTLTTGDTHVVSLKGRYLDGFTPSYSSFLSHGMDDATQILLDQGEMRVSFQPIRAGSMTIGPDQFETATLLCAGSPDSFSISFNGVDRPRTPTPTATPTSTPTATPVTFHPIARPSIVPGFPFPTPTPTPRPRKGP